MPHIRHSHLSARTVLLAGVTLFALACVLPAWGQITRVSLRDGTSEADHPNQEADDHSTTSLYGLSSSADGTIVAFSTFAENLVPNDGNGFSDVYVRNTLTNETELVSVAQDGGPGNNISYQPAISKGGRWVAFASLASNLVPDDTNGVVDVFLRDLHAGRTIRISTGPDGGQATTFSSFPSIATNADETIVYISFTSSATNLVAGGSNGLPHIFHCTYFSDMDAKITRQVSIGPGQIEGDEASVLSAISADGRYVIYTTYIWNIIPPSKTKPDVPVLQLLFYDAAVGYSNFRLITTPDAGTFPAISGDGRFFAFVQDRNVILYDVLRKASEVVSVGPLGEAGDGTSYEPSISSDGRFVAFTSSSTNLVTGDTNGAEDVFVRDRAIRKCIRVSLTQEGKEANLDSRAPSISADGKRVVFSSSATNIIPTDTNNREDAYVSLWRNPFQAPGSQPNMMIRNADETWYYGVAELNVTAEGQTATQIADRSGPVVYQLKVRNEGTAPDTFIIAGSGPTSGWTVRYFDALADGNDITSQVIGPGFAVGPLAPGAYAELRLEVGLEPGVDPTAPHTALITGTSSADATNIDVIKAFTTKTALASQPDLLVKNEKDAWYTGDGVINSTAANQSVSQTADWTRPAVYHLKVQNDGTISDSFSIAGDAGGSGWTVRYFDAVTGGNDITAAVIGYGHSTAQLVPGASTEMRVEVAVDPGVRPSASWELFVTVRSATDATITDTVKTTTSAPQPRTATHQFAAGTWLTGVPLSPVDPQADLVFGTSRVARWNADSQSYAYFTGGAFDVSPGTGYWVRYDAPHSMNLQGFAPSSPLTLDVMSDWNLLSNPGAASLPWGQVASTGRFQPFGWVQKDDGSGYELVTTLNLSNAKREIAAWKGFWFRALEEGTVTLGSVAPAGAVADVPAVDWAVQLAAIAGAAADTANYIGVSQGAATVGANPPASGAGYVDLYCVDASGARNAVALQAAGRTLAWNLVAETDLADVPVRISFEDLSQVPGDVALTLTDLQTGKRLNMRTTSGYVFQSGASGASRQLRIEAGPRSGQALITAAAVAGTGNGLQIAYTLSAPGNVRAEILNIAGRTVAVIDLGRQEAGAQTASWNGVASGGARVPAGQYLVTITCVGEDGTSASRVVPAALR